MKTTLGIFGDSYASQQLSMHNNYPSWVDILNDSYQVTCHSIAYESSLYETKSLFDQFYTNYDNIVFVITDPYRFQLQLKELLMSCLQSCVLRENSMNSF
jgi:hypothetical protein